jgi:hypothetical protein
MTKKKSIFTLQYALLGIGVGLIIYTLMKKKSTSNSVQNQVDNNTIVPPAESPLLTDSQGCPIDRYGNLPAAYLINESKVLSKKVPAVFEYETVLLQRKLNKKGACLNVDGFFEDKTETAVKKITGNSSVSLQTLLLYGI